MSEMTAKEYLKTKKRMCEKNTSDCDDCPLSQKKNCKNCGCNKLEEEYPNEAIAIVQKWGEEHPVKTLMERFFEVFPDTPKEKNGTPSRTCPRHIGYKDLGCGMSSDDCLKCWSQPYVEPKGEE